MRKILHVDMDAFYASVEQRDDPALRGRPIAVGGGGPRGVVMTASYEARRFGVRSAMPGSLARRLCPALVFVRPRMDLYRAISLEIRAIFARYTELIEPLGFDEAFLDVTEPRTGPATAARIARRIKADIRAETGLTASAGVSFAKFLAKIASGLRKPDGLTVIPPERAQAFIHALPIERFHGIGPVTARKMRALGIETGADLAARPEDELARRFGKAGIWYRQLALGIDPRPVRPDRARKSIGAERTFDADLVELSAMEAMLAPIAVKLGERLAASDLVARTLTLKIKHADFTINTRACSRPLPFAGADALLDEGKRLLTRPALPDRPVRLLGLSVSALEPLEMSERGQLELALASVG